MYTTVGRRCGRCIVQINTRVSRPGTFEQPRLAAYCVTTLGEMTFIGFGCVCPDGRPIKVFEIPRDSISTPRFYCVWNVTRTRPVRTSAMYISRPRAGSVVKRLTIKILSPSFPPSRKYCAGRWCIRENSTRLTFKTFRTRCTTRHGLCCVSAGGRFASLGELFNEFTNPIHIYIYTYLLAEQRTRVLNNDL